MTFQGKAQRHEKGQTSADQEGVRVLKLLICTHKWTEKRSKRKLTKSPKYTTTKFGL